MKNLLNILMKNLPNTDTWLFRFVWPIAITAIIAFVNYISLTYKEMNIISLLFLVWLIAIAAFPSKGTANYSAIASFVALFPLVVFFSLELTALLIPFALVISIIGFLHGSFEVVRGHMTKIKLSSGLLIFIRILSFCFIAEIVPFFFFGWKTGAMIMLAIFLLQFICEYADERNACRTQPA